MGFKEEIATEGGNDFFNRGSLWGFVFISQTFTLLHFMARTLNASIYKPTFHYWSLCLFTCHCQSVPLCLLVLLFVKDMIYEYVV